MNQKLQIILQHIEQDAELAKHFSCKSWMDTPALAENLDFIMQHLTVEADFAALDIGVGNGRSSFFLVEFYRRVIGVDNNVDVYESDTWRKRGIDYFRKLLGERFEFHASADRTYSYIADHSIDHAWVIVPGFYTSSGSMNDGVKTLHHSIDDYLQKFLLKPEAIERILKKPHGRLILNLIPPRRSWLSFLNPPKHTVPGWAKDLRNTRFSLEFSGLDKNDYLTLILKLAS